MKEHIMKLTPFPFEMIRNGKKTIELIIGIYVLYLGHFEVSVQIPDVQFVADFLLYN